MIILKMTSKHVFQVAYQDRKGLWMIVESTARPRLLSEADVSQNCSHCRALTMLRVLDAAADVAWSEVVKAVRGLDDTAI